MALFEYFKINDEVDTLRYSSNVTRKVFAGGKILAKGIANVGLLAMTEMPVIAAKKILASDSATEEQKEKAREILNRNK
ncbi:hypothetical protein MIS33_04085 [Wielerella bovis]|uniref:hypothetical protein n=1 Tax=Wielerella bovis TaxID=2917790 RepID=UPI0020194EE3|nr:hypothetical protein [Wielerella bovis]ULJ63227.1 hypothetical protein MIS46_04040 [Wielerella bovis]ULJ65455.1 hypothetical protein MIS33_04085 [Wielerella bovis]